MFMLNHIPQYLTTMEQNELKTSQKRTPFVTTIGVHPNTVVYYVIYHHIYL